MRVVFAGTPQVALSPLQALLDSAHDVVGVITRPDAPAGRGRGSRPSPVKELAQAHDIPVLTPQHPREESFVAELVALRPDCVPVVAYGALVPKGAREVPRHGWVNLHFSLLPAWRGAAPVQHALLAGDDVSGVTVFQLAAGMDTGPVLATMAERLRPDDTAGAVLDRFASAGAGLLLQVLDALEQGDIHAVPQPEDGVSRAPKLGSADARVDWSRPAVAIDRLVRACTPAPGAWTTFEGRRFKLGPLMPVVSDDPLGPGQLRLVESQVLVGTGTAALGLGTVQPEGKRSMAAGDWARGLRVGEHLGFDHA